MSAWPFESVYVGDVEYVPKVTSPELTDERIAAARTRVNDLWPEGLEAVPGSYEVALKRDADTIRAALSGAENGHPEASA